MDRHFHPRMGNMLKLVLPYTLRQQAQAGVIMGNHGEGKETSTIAKTVPRIKEVRRCLKEHGYLRKFTPIFTCYLTDDLSVAELVEGFRHDYWRAVKVYLADKKGEGGTTNSQHGVRDLKGRYRLFAAMEKFGIPLLGHWEAPEEGADEFDREKISIERDLAPIRKRFPDLRIVVEHLTTKDAADFVNEAGDNTYATVTSQHLMLNRNALFRGGLCPQHWCKPVLKREYHRLAVRKYVTSGHLRFGAGTDSAPHDKEKKSLPCGCAAGIFSAVDAVELYATVFDEDGATEFYGNFMSSNFISIYGLDVSDEGMLIERAPFAVPETVGSKAAGKVIVFKGGETLPWRLVA